MTLVNWDALAESFDIHDPSQAQASAADNKLIAWPEILGMLEAFNSTPGQDPITNILDFGCGTGSFAAELTRRKYQVVGIDPAVEMIKKARQLYKDPHFIHSDAVNLLPSMCFDAVVSIMVFQFIADPNQTFKYLARHVRDGGILIIAVHSPEYVRASLAKGHRFQESENTAHPTLWIEFANRIRIEVFLRDLTSYTRDLAAEGFSLLQVATPPFTEDYINLYGRGSLEPLETPKFLIMAFQKVRV